MPRTLRAFTLIELLVVIAIISCLCLMVLVGIPMFQRQGQKAAALNEVRQIGVAFELYAGDNNNYLPGRSEGGQADKWPRLLVQYMGDDPRAYAAPGDSKNYLRRNLDPKDLDRGPLSNSQNNTSYIMNGYNDIGAFDDPGVTVSLTRIQKPSQLILLGTPKTGSQHFYMDMLEGGGNHKEVLDLTRYGDGSIYLMADGSARFLTEKTYDPELWLVNKDFAIP